MALAAVVDVGTIDDEVAAVVLSAAGDTGVRLPDTASSKIRRWLAHLRPRWNAGAAGLGGGVHHSA
ncbi:MAG TPA: hypothetical protein VK360_06560 [Acidimicrobiales bacterium]|nr:hypothetical protein [Acidimicrobiales bacterium]